MAAILKDFMWATVELFISADVAWAEARKWAEKNAVEHKVDLQKYPGKPNPLEFLEEHHS